MCVATQEARQQKFPSWAMRPQEKLKLLEHGKPDGNGGTYVKNGFVSKTGEFYP
jgi:hypothetical protein